MTCRSHSPRTDRPDSNTDRVREKCPATSPVERLSSEKENDRHDRLSSSSSSSSSSSCNDNNNENDNNNSGRSNNNNNNHGTARGGADRGRRSFTSFGITDILGRKEETPPSSPPRHDSGHLSHHYDQKEHDEQSPPHSPMSSSPEPSPKETATSITPTTPVMPMRVGLGVLGMGAMADGRWPGNQGQHPALSQWQLGQYLQGGPRFSATASEYTLSSPSWFKQMLYVLI